MTTTDLEQLLEMGFEKERAELAVSRTGGCTLSQLLFSRFPEQTEMLSANTNLVTFSAGCP